MSRRAAQRLRRSESGSVAAEHVLLITLIALVLIVALFKFGAAVNSRIDEGATCVNSADPTVC